MSAKEDTCAPRLPWQWPEATRRGIVSKVRAGCSLKPSQWKDHVRAEDVQGGDRRGPDDVEERSCQS
jgi:hypothetical protein